MERIAQSTDAVILQLFFITYMFLAAALINTTITMVTMVQGITSQEVVGDLDQTGLAPITAGRLDGLQAAVIDEPLALQVPGQPQVSSSRQGGSSSNKLVMTSFLGSGG